MTAQTTGEGTVADRLHRRNAGLAAAIADDFYSDRLDMAARGTGPVGWSAMPEVKAVARLRRDGQRELTVRRFLTFVSAMDRARDSNRLWSDAAKMLDLRPEAFDPAEASAVPPNQLCEALSAARVSQRHHDDSAAWRTIARSLHAGQGAVAKVVEQGKGDARELLKDLCSASSEGRRRYPLLRGTKLGPLWVRVMAAPGGAEVENIHVVPVAVDVHVRRVTENLGVASTTSLPMRKAKPVIRAAWKSAVDAARFGGPPGIAGTCGALDPALWAFGKHGCANCEKAGRRVPIGAACQRCQWLPD